MSKKLLTLLSESGKIAAVDAIETLAMLGLYPKEFYKMMEAYIEAHQDHPVFHESPPVPQLEELINMCKDRARTQQSDCEEAQS